MKQTTPSRNTPTFIGIDFHKRYSVFCVVDSAGRILGKGRIDHGTPQLFIDRYGQKTLSVAQDAEAEIDEEEAKSLALQPTGTR